jgi:predicted nicotinamide N-methyase
MYAGASVVTGADIDAFAAAAIELNARANGRRVTAVRRDVLGEGPPDADVILAGDCWYDARLAGRVLPWLQRARDRGIDVLVGDPGRRYLPTDELFELASYDVRTTTELEDLERKQGRVYAVRPDVERAHRLSTLSRRSSVEPLVAPIRPAGRRRRPRACP